jgi:hypothetical protein
MPNKLFDIDWKEKTFKELECHRKSWANDLIDNYDEIKVYLEKLSKWFDEFCLLIDKNGKEKLRNELQNINNQNHLGAVNELTWWKFLSSRGFNLKPIATNNNKATPDFELKYNESDIVFEVTTLNEAQDIKTRINETQDQSYYRMIANSLYNKRKQIEEIHK